MPNTCGRQLTIGLKARVNMKMILPFGDWSRDAHGYSVDIFIDAPDPQTVRNAQIQIEEKYGIDFWDNYANEYGEPYLGKIQWQALIDTKYPFDNFKKYQEDNTFDNYSCLEEVYQKHIIEKLPFYKDSGADIYFTLETIIDNFIWLLNYYGAQITRIDSHTFMLCNWTCPGFKTVGYGCF